MFKKLIGGLMGQRIGKDLDTLVKAYSEQKKFSGAVLVARGDEILLRKGYGLANLEHAVPNLPETVFRIGSMTKPFTALLVMQLVDAGKVSLHDRLNQYMPDFPNGERITLHHLLSNTSGIPDYIVMPEYEKIMKQSVSLPNVFTLFRNKPLIFEPGTDFGYSNSNWVLLGYIIEQVTGQSYADVLREHIFGPAGMTYSGVEWEQPIIQHRAQGYVDTGAGMLNAQWIDDATMHAAGAIYSTLDDLYQWDRALYGDGLLRQPTLQHMWTPISEKDNGSYGYGWEIRYLHKRRVIAHSGGLPGYISDIARFVEDDVVIIVLSNLGSAAYSDMVQNLSAAVLGEPYQLPAKRTFVSVDPAVFADYVGCYELTYFGRKSVLNFTVEGDKLLMKVHGLPIAILSPMSETTYFARSKGEVELTFVRDPNGQVNNIDVLWDKFDLKAVRLLT